MMTQTHLEHLLNVTAPRRENLPDPASSRIERTWFGDHLAQASGTLAPPENPKPAREDAAPAVSRPEPNSTAGAGEPAAGDSEHNEPTVAEVISSSDQSETTEGEDEESKTSPVGSSGSEILTVRPAGDEAAGEDEAGEDSTVDNDEAEQESADQVSVTNAQNETVAPATKFKLTHEADPKSAVADALPNKTQINDAEAKQSSPDKQVNFPENAPTTPSTSADLTTKERSIAVEAQPNQAAKPLNEHVASNEPGKVNEIEIDASSASPENVDADRKTHEKLSAGRDSLSPSESDRAVPESAKAEVGTSPTSGNPVELGGRTSDRSLADHARRRATERRQTVANQGPEASAAASDAFHREPRHDIAIEAGAVAAITSNGSEPVRDLSIAARSKSEVLMQAWGRPHREIGTTGRGGRAETDSNLPRVDAARFVGRVAKAIQTAHERGGTLQLRLSPPELGSLRLELTFQNGAMTATVEAETPAARQVLLDHLPSLRDRLAEQNIRIDRFDVDVRQENSGGHSDQRASQQEQHSHRPFQQAPERRDPSRIPVHEEPSREASLGPARAITDGINMLA